MRDLLLPTGNRRLVQAFRSCGAMRVENFDETRLARLLTVAGDDDIETLVLLDEHRSSWTLPLAATDAGF